MNSALRQESRFTQAQAFLTWTLAAGVRPSALTQAHIDAYYNTCRPYQRDCARAFLVWAAGHGHIPARLDIPRQEIPHRAGHHPETPPRPAATAVTWYEDGTPAGGADMPAGRLRDCEKALRRAGFHVENTSETTGGCLLAWRRTRLR
jgi:hypothetical protein